MTTYLRSGEAARRLGVTTATLYSYVSRGRISRRLAVDGRTSLFDLDELEAVAARNRRPTPPPPTIDVRISTAVTQLGEEGPRYRGIPVDELVHEPFESVAELLWSGDLPDGPPDPRWRTPNTACTFDGAAETSETMRLIRITTAVAPSDDAPTFARSLIAAMPSAFHGTSRADTYAGRLTRAWVRRPSPELVRAVNTTLVLLADHELATSTLAVRVAASVRASPAAAIIAGLSTLGGDLHGSASGYAHRLFAEIDARDARTVIDEMRSRHERVPGFGHTIYRNRDPRFDLLLEHVVGLPDPDGRLQAVTGLLDVSGALVTREPNIDLALGALTWVAGLPAETPLFAIARIAGWTAHYLEEIEERPVRYRGLAH